MTTALDTIRYHSGIAGEEVAELVDSLEQEVSTLREQVEKLTKFAQNAEQLYYKDMAERTTQIEALTKERDELHRAFNQPVPRSEWEKMQEQLAALAEQNEKLRKVLVEAKSMVGHPDNIAIINSALSLPDLATPALNRIKAEAYREAAMHCSKHGSRTADEVSEDLFANADELEQSK